MGIVNFRDFGGLPSRLGGMVKSDHLYRSGAPHMATEDEYTRLISLNFDTIADLRYYGERAIEPSPWPSDGVKHIIFHDGPESVEAPHIAPMRNGTLDEDISDRIYVQLYRDLPFDRHYRPLISRVLARLTELHGRLLVHCTAGKDRTGMVVALIQYALGVSRDDIFADYMKSSQEPGLMAMADALVEHAYERQLAPISLPLARHLLDVKPDYLDAFFSEIENRAGSINAYFDAVGFDARARETLSERMLSG